MPQDGIGQAMATSFALVVPFVAPWSAPGPRHGRMTPLPFIPALRAGAGGRGYSAPRHAADLGGERAGFKTQYRRA